MSETNRTTRKTSPGLIVTVAVFGISLFVLFGWILLPGGLRHSDSHGASLETPDPTDFEPVKGERTPPVDLAAAFAPPADGLVRGKELYTMQCATCHGDTGAGDGPAGKALKPPARDFTNPDGWTRGDRLSEIYRTLSEGIRGTGMVAYDTLSPEERFALAHYVQSLGSFDHASDDEASIAALDREFSLSEGVQRPSRVPVSTAEERLAVEFGNPHSIPLPGDEDSSEGARILRLAVADPIRAARTLEEVPNWREEVGSLSEAVVSGLPDNGFSAESASLDTEQWVLLQETLITLMPREDELE